MVSSTNYFGYRYLSWPPPFTGLDAQVAETRLTTQTSSLDFTLNDMNQCYFQTIALYIVKK